MDSIRARIQENQKKTNDLANRLQSALSIPRIAIVPHKGFFRVLELTKAQSTKAEKCPDLIRQILFLQSKIREDHFLFVLELITRRLRLDSGKILKVIILSCVCVCYYGLLSKVVCLSVTFCFNG